MAIDIGVFIFVLFLLSCYFSFLLSHYFSVSDYNHWHLSPSFYFASTTRVVIHTMCRCPTFSISLHFFHDCSYRYNTVPGIMLGSDNRCTHFNRMNANTMCKWYILRSDHSFVCSKSAVHWTNAQSPTDTLINHNWKLNRSGG